jgi:hypothetical protein
MGSISQDNRYPGRDLNLGLCEYEAVVLTDQPSFFMLHLSPFQQILPRPIHSTFFLFYVLYSNTALRPCVVLVNKQLLTKTLFSAFFSRVSFPLRRPHDLRNSCSGKGNKIEIDINALGLLYGNYV